MKCTDKERMTCNSEKMTCEGCYYDAKEANRQLTTELEKKNKIIDLMAEFISNTDIDEDICSKKTDDCYADIHDENACISCIKEYFERQVENGR